MTKRYRLLKPLPDCNAGAIYHSTDNGKDYVCYENMSDGLNHNWSVAYDKKYVENNPEWFEEIKPEPITDNKEFTSDFNKVPFGLYEIFWKSGGSSLAAIGGLHSGERWIAPTNWTNKHYPTGKMNKHKDSIEKMILLHSKSSHPSTEPEKKEGNERISVSQFFFECSSTYGKDYVVTTNKSIPGERFPAIKKAIEQVLNDELDDLKIWEKEFPKAQMEKLTEQYRAMTDAIGQKKYSQKELDEAIENAFNAARLWHGLVGAKYDTFEDYKQSLSSQNQKH